MMTMRESTVSVGGDTTTVVFEPATENEIADTVFVCAHGAGGNMSARGMLALANVLRKNGIGVARFNFLYKEKRSGLPDSMPKLEETFAAVVATIREGLNPAALFIGGRSMGGKAASIMAAKNVECDGLMLYAYPLHPAGQPNKLRDAHLPDIAVSRMCDSITSEPYAGFHTPTR